MPDESPYRLNLDTEREAINATISDLSDTLLSPLPPRLAEAVQYSLTGPGKRLRGILVLYAYRAAGGVGDATPLAAAVEIIHSYSLVHDDLPCMDDDTFRRGRPTTHLVYGVETATLAGVVMIPIAVQAVISGARKMGLSGEQAAIIVEVLLHAAGASGMIGGQLRDLRAEGEQVTLDALEAVHRSKTGALIAASAKIGGIAAGASQSALDALDRYGADLGLAFQIVDDVLDVTATTDQLGKTAGRDVALNKSTYPGLLGVDGAISRAHAFVNDGCEALLRAGLLTPELQQVANLVITRTN
jgi:geranylgeranyl diphosphate synthase type II